MTDWPGHDGHTELTRGAVTLLVMFLSVSLAFLALRASKLHEGAFDDQYTTTIERAKALSPFWIDVRDKEDYNKGHVFGALWFDDTDWEEAVGMFLKRWDGKSPIVVYCEGRYCDRSQVVSARLRKDLGNEMVYHVRGGWPVVVRSGLPMEAQP